MNEHAALELAKAFTKAIPANNNDDILFKIHSELRELKEKLNTDDKIILSFSGNDKLNASMAAKALGIKQTQIEELVNAGRLQPYSLTKMIFKASDILKYINLNK
jgi:hypothetical protein